MEGERGFAVEGRESVHWFPLNDVCKCEWPAIRSTPVGRYSNEPFTILERVLDEIQGG